MDSVDFTVKSDELICALCLTDDDELILVNETYLQKGNTNFISYGDLVKKYLEFEAKIVCDTCMMKIVDFYEFQEAVKKRILPNQIQILQGKLEKHSLTTVKELVENYAKLNEISNFLQITVQDDLLVIQEVNPTCNETTETICEEEILDEMEFKENSLVEMDVETLEEEDVPQECFDVIEEEQKEEVPLEMTCSCGKSFSSERTYNNHKNQNICGVKVCPNSQCNQEFNSFMDLKKHCKICCPDAKIFTGREEQRHKEYPGCRICRKRFNQGNLSQFKNHEDQHKSYKYLLEKGYLNLFDCTTCGKAFVKEAELEAHKELHLEQDNEEIRMFECQFCLDQFTSIYEIKEHITFKHMDRFECPLPNCKTVNNAFRLWYYHFQKSHPGFIKIDTNFPCEYCNTVFDSYYNLERHKKSDECTGKSFKCSHCSKKFGDRNLLVVHLRQISKPEICQICGKQNLDAYRLKEHMAIHSNLQPFKCTHCDRAFKSKGKLVNHVRMHAVDRVYKCDLCSFAGATTKKLIEHKKRTHSEPKPCPIPECSSIVGSKKYLPQHLKQVHKMNGPEIYSLIREFHGGRSKPLMIPPVD